MCVLPPTKLNWENIYKNGPNSCKFITRCQSRWNSSRFWAAHNAFRAVYRNTSISGCFFLLGQSIRRKVSDDGLKCRLKTIKNFRWWFGRCLLRPFGSSYPARYPAVTWDHTHQALDCLPKSTNCVEGFHNELLHGLLKHSSPCMGLFQRVTQGCWCCTLYSSTVSCPK